MGFQQALKGFEGKAREILARNPSPAPRPIEKAQEAPKPEERYQGAGSFNRLYQKALKEVSGKVSGVNLEGQAREEEARLEVEIERLWMIGEAQEEAQNEKAKDTYQAFRQAVTKWYRLWIQAKGG